MLNYSKKNTSCVYPWTASILCFFFSCLAPHPWTPKCKLLLQTFRYHHCPKTDRHSFNSPFPCACRAVPCPPQRSPFCAFAYLKSSSPIMWWHVENDRWLCSCCGPSSSCLPISNFESNPPACRLRLLARARKNNGSNWLIRRVVRAMICTRTIDFDFMNAIDIYAAPSLYSWRRVDLVQPPCLSMPRLDLCFYS